MKLNRSASCVRRSEETKKRPCSWVQSRIEDRNALKECNTSTAVVKRVAYTPQMKHPGGLQSYCAAYVHFTCGLMKSCSAILDGTHA